MLTFLKWNTVEVQISYLYAIKYVKYPNCLIDKSGTGSHVMKQWHMNGDEANIQWHVVVIAYISRT
jgi:hypothetical protein